GQSPAVVRVLLADLIDWGHIRARPPVPVAEHADMDVLRKVLDGLEAKL
ncbi:RNA polymerase subunit sigma-24, partial [Streptomyces varsoviensis]